MIVGVPKEVKKQEHRVALLPSAAYQLAKRGHKIVAERGCGIGAGFLDKEYETAGATLVDTHAAVFEQADLIVKVKEPQPAEVGMLRRGQILFTYLHLAADAEQARGLMKSGVTALAYETVTAGDGSLPLLTPMSEVAGRMSVQVGAHYLEKEAGGAGVLLPRTGHRTEVPIAHLGSIRSPVDMWG